MNISRRVPLMTALAMALVLAACGGGGGGGAAADDAEELPDRAVASSEDPEGTTYPLREGRYRLSYRAPGCEDVIVSIQSVDGSFTYEQEPRGFTSFINDVLPGEYTIAVTSDCDEWTINLNEF